MTDYQTGNPSGSSGSTAQAAKDEAASVARSAADSGGHLAGQAKAEAGEITREATRQAKDVLDRGREELAGTASAQQRKLAEGVRSFSGELHAMADAASEPGIASDVAHQVARQADGVASWLDEREPADLLEDVKTFARNRPGTFLAIALGAGIVVGRLTRGLKDASSDDDATVAGAHRAPGAASTTAPERTSAYGAAAGVSSYGTGAATGATGSTYDTGATSGTEYGAAPAYGSTTSTGAGSGYADGVGSEGLAGEGTTEWPDTAGGTPTYGVEGDDQPTQAFSAEEIQSQDGDALTPEPSWPPVEGEGDRR